jgi:hypothetical protein
MSSTRAYWEFVNSQILGIAGINFHSKAGTRTITLGAALGSKSELADEVNEGEIKSIYVASYQ